MMVVWTIDFRDHTGKLHEITRDYVVMTQDPGYGKELYHNATELTAIVSSMITTEIHARWTEYSQWREWETEQWIWTQDRKFDVEEL
jgi:hypothetical protein